MVNNHIILRNGVEMPNMAMSANWYGHKQMKALFVAGLKAGVRAFDTAREYRVEKEVGVTLQEAMAEVGVKREEVFIQTRISNEEMRKGEIEREVEKSLKTMHLEYIDCYMIHWPTPDYYVNTLKKLFAVKDAIRSVGVCNFRIRHFKQLKETGVEMPHILQAEFHPLRQAPGLVKFCRENDIAIQAFSPLCKMIPKIKNHPVLNELAEKYNVSLAQFILKWHLQYGLCPISLTSKVERVHSNFCLYDFIISEEDMRIMATVNEEYKFHLESATCPGF